MFEFEYHFCDDFNKVLGKIKFNRQNFLWLENKVIASKFKLFLNFFL